MRGKLIELLEEAEGMVNNDEPSLEQIADYLIANGVTIATDNNAGHKWIPVTERLPEEFAEYLCRIIRPIPGGKYVRENRVLWCDYDKNWNCERIIVTHWMPLPEPPKEGE